MIRAFDILLSSLGILLLFPFGVCIYLAIILSSKGGGFYKQTRVGQFNSDFEIYKFRSMYLKSDSQGLLTLGQDNRMTSVGKFIRKYKIDELPQLINVFKNDMSMVGPRPEVRKYVDLYSEQQLKILTVPPGLADYASLKYRKEGEILDKVPNPEMYYISKIMPDKLSISMIYAENRNLKDYFKIIFLSIFHTFK